MSNYKAEAEIHFGDDDRLDIAQEIDGHGEVVQFVINYRARFKVQGNRG
jgi:hypothetical protein